MCFFRVCSVVAFAVASSYIHAVWQLAVLRAVLGTTVGTLASVVNIFLSERVFLAVFRVKSHFINHF